MSDDEYVPANTCTAMPEDAHKRAEAFDNAFREARDTRPGTVPVVHGNQSPLDRQDFLRDSTCMRRGEVVSDAECKTGRLAIAVKLGCVADAYAASHEDIVKEAAIQLELHLSGGDCDTFDYGHIHNYLQIITLFLVCDKCDAPYHALRRLRRPRRGR
eukprot:337312-Prymnesium_polylepis.1